MPDLSFVGCRARQHGVVITGNKTQAGYEVAFDQVVYSEGLNKKTLKRVLEAVEECGKKIQDVVK